MGHGGLHRHGSSRRARARAPFPHTPPPPPPHTPPRPRSDQLARAKDRLRVDLGHLAHPVYGAPELAQALHESPAEYLPIVSGGGDGGG